MNIFIIKRLVVIVMVLLSAGHGLSAIPQQFSYGYKNEIAFNNSPAFELDPKIESLASTLHAHLNQSILFDSGFVGDSRNVRRYLQGKEIRYTWSSNPQLKPRLTKDFIGEFKYVKTDDGVVLGSTYFNRGSDTLLVIAEGFANVREYMAPFIAMFPDYDIVIFDFRGHGIKDEWSLSLGKAGFGIDGNLVTLGHKEDKDVHAIVDGFRKLKSFDEKTQKYDPSKGYKKVYGLGLCYGAFVITKAQATSPGLFDKLILDGCWHSLDLFTDKIKNDLYTIWSPQKGGWSDHWFFGNSLVKDAVESVVKNYLLEIKDLPLLDYASLIDKTPILCIHGKDDYMIYKNEFEQLWNAFVTPEKTAFLTSNPHVRNHWNQKELYKLVCELFLEVPHNEFAHYLQNSKDLATYHANNYAKKLIND